jgi:hypothetical protein
VNGELARVRGLLLVGDTDRTTVVVDTVLVTVPSNRAVTALKRDGDLRVLGICVTGGARFVHLGGVRLKGVRPNPLREGAEIELESEGSAEVVIRVYDGYGREVGKLLDGAVSAGERSIHWDASELSSGVYICELESGGVRQRAAVLVVR